MNDQEKDRIAELLQRTGARPSVPEERTRRVHDQVLAHWRREVRQTDGPRRIRRNLVLAAAAIFLTAIGLLAWNHYGTFPGADRAMTVEVIRGTAWLETMDKGHGQAGTVLTEGERLSFGTGVITGVDGGVAIRTPAGGSVRLAADSSLRLVSSDTLTLERGALYVDSRGSDSAEAESFKIRTPFGDVQELGTQFEVRLADEGLRVRVREGAIVLQHGDAPLQVTAGGQIELSLQGEPIRDSIDPASPEWGWTGSLTPMMEIEGRPAQDFLEWIAREKGLRLEFQDTDLFSSAKAIALDGSIQGMTLDQALEAVLPTCDMTYRIEHGVLIVGRAGEQGA